MDEIKQYLLSVTAMALLCGIATTLVSNKNSVGTLLKFLCGLIMTITLIMPITNIDLRNSFRIFDDLTVDANGYVSDGTTFAFSQKSEIINQHAEAYILDKATSMNVTLDVEVLLCDTDPPVPKSVSLSGNISPYCKMQLSQIICEDLGIPEEQQIWT